MVTLGLVPKTIHKSTSKYFPHHPHLASSGLQVDDLLVFEGEREPEHVCCPVVAEKSGFHLICRPYP